MSKNTAQDLQIISEKPSSLTHLRRKTVVSFMRTWQEIRNSAMGSTEVRASLPKDDVKDLRKHMQMCYDSPGGEITARSHTAELGRVYLKLNDGGRKKFLKLLATDFGLDADKLCKVAKSYIAETDETKRYELEPIMRDALIAPRRTILRQFTALPNGFKFLINMRADLLPLVKKDIQLRGLESDLKVILSSWFDVGLLDLTEISWDSPASLLEKLIEYEAVHKVSSWHDLKNRMDSDRRVFAFFHNKMPLDPLIFVQVALVKGMSDSIQDLLDEESPPLDQAKADTAIFYSITNAQKGLAGISFGNFLIKRVVSQLTDEMKQIKTFATLSPIPGFRRWLDPQLASEEGKLLTNDECKALKCENDELKARKIIAQYLSTNDWISDKKISETLKPIMLRLCTHYLVNEKRGKRPLDPVASFHLFNGARLERINWLADTSENGLKQSAAMMVNYHYKLDEIDDNHEEFAAAGKIVAARHVKSYLK